MDILYIFENTLSRDHFSSTDYILTFYESFFFLFDYDLEVFNSQLFARFSKILIRLFF